MQAPVINWLLRHLRTPQTGVFFPIFTACHPLCLHGFVRPHLVMIPPQDHAVQVLHCFVMSRILLPLRPPPTARDGFKGPLEIESWLCNIPDDMVPTLVGDVPRWIADSDHPPPAGGGMYGDILEQGPGHARGTATESRGGSSRLPLALSHLQSEAVGRMLMEPMGRFTLLGRKVSEANSGGARCSMMAAAAAVSDYAVRTALAEAYSRKAGGVTSGGMSSTSSSQMKTEMVQLQQLASSGLPVAQRMLDARSSWLLGEFLLDCGDKAGAVASWARALRLGTHDGDPFSGWWILMDAKGGGLIDEGRYLTAVDSAVDSARGQVAVAFGASYLADAFLVKACLHMASRQLDLALETVLGGLQVAPDDALGLISLKGIIHGNRSEWPLALEAYERALAVVPSEPIFYFW